MEKVRRRILSAGLVASALALMPVVNVMAQASYPSKTIKFIVPYAPGGLPDTVARILGQRLGERLGQSIIVDNRPGGNGVVSAQALATAPADGYTFLVTDGSMFSVNPQINSNLSYNFKRDFVPVSLVARAPLFLAAHPSVPINSLNDFVAYVKSKPGAVNYGSSGIGSTHHLSMESMASTLGLQLTHVPFRGSGQSVPALIGGQVEVLFSAYPSLSGFVKDNKVKILATNGGTRSSQAPDIPSIAEIIPGFDFAPIIGVLAQHGTPSSIVQKLSQEIAVLAKQKDFVDHLAKAGIESVGGSAEEYATAIQAENERYAQVIKKVGLTAQ